MTCSQRQASSWTFSQSSPITSIKQPLGQPVLAHHPGRPAPALVGQFQMTVTLHVDEVVALHPGHRLRNGRAALVQPLGDPGPKRDDALLLELVDGAKVHLGRVDQVAHAVTSLSSAGAAQGVSASLGPRARLEHECSTPALRSGGCVETSVWRDNPALRRAIDDGEAVLPLFVLDPALLASAGTARRAWLMAALHVLDAELRDAGGPGLSVVRGKPSSAVPRVAQEVEAASVHIAADFAPYGRRRDERVADALAEQGRELVPTGSPYAVAPGTLFNKSGGPFQVFTPFHRTWLEHGVHEPAPAVRASSVDWLAAGEPGRDPRRPTTT